MAVLRPIERLPQRLDVGVRDLDPALCERAVTLLDLLRRSEISPYVMSGSSTDLVQNVATRMQTDDFKNSSDGPFLLTRISFFTIDALAAAASGAVFSNVAAKIIDNDRKPPLTKIAVLLPALVSIADNTISLDRPHVMAPGGSFTVILREQNIGAITNAYAALRGEMISGGLLSAAQVRELIALGLYPGMLGRDQVWTQNLFVNLLFGDGPRCGSQAGEMLRWALRERVAELLSVLRRTRSSAYAFHGRVLNIATNTTTSMPTDSFRNDSGFPVLITRIKAATYTTVAATAAGAVFNNVAFVFFHSGPNRSLTRSPVLAPCLFSISDNEWVFERPLVLGPDEALDVRLVEQSVNDTTDVYVGLQGVQMPGISAEELRECVSLGLVQPWKRDSW